MTTPTLLRTVAAAIICTAFAAVAFAAAALQDLRVDARDAAGLGGTYTIPPGTYGTVAVTNIDGCHVAAGPGVVVEGAAVIAAPQRNGTVTVTGGRYTALWVGNVTHPGSADDTMTGAESHIAITEATVDLNATAHLPSLAAHIGTTTATPLLSAALRIPVLALSRGVTIKDTAVNVILSTRDAASPASLPDITGIQIQDTGAPGVVSLLSNVTATVDVESSFGHPTGIKIGSTARHSGNQGHVQITGATVSTVLTTVPGQTSTTADPPSAAAIVYAATGAEPDSAVLPSGLFLSKSTIHATAQSTTPTDGGVIGGAFGISATSTSSRAVSSTVPIVSVSDGCTVTATALGSDAGCRAAPDVKARAISMSSPSYAPQIPNSPLMVKHSALVAKARHGVAVGFTFEISRSAAALTGTTVIEDVTISAAGSLCPSLPTLNPVAIGIEAPLWRTLVLRDTTIRADQAPWATGKGRVLGAMIYSVSDDLCMLRTDNTTVLLGTKSPKSATLISQATGLWFQSGTMYTNINFPAKLVMSDSTVKIEHADSGTGVLYTDSRDNGRFNVSITNATIEIDANTHAGGIMFADAIQPNGHDTWIHIIGGHVHVTCAADNSECTGIVLPYGARINGALWSLNRIYIAPNAVVVKADKGNAIGIQMIGKTWCRIVATIAPQSLIVSGGLSAVGVNTTALEDLLIDGDFATMTVSLPFASVQCSDTSAEASEKSAAVYVSAGVTLIQTTIGIGDVSTSSRGVVLNVALRAEIRGLTASAASISVTGPAALDAIRLLNTRQAPSQIGDPQNTAYVTIRDVTAAVTGGVHGTAAIVAASTLLNVALENVKATATPHSLFGAALSLTTEGIDLSVRQSTLRATCKSLACLHANAIVAMSMTVPITVVKSTLSASSASGSPVVQLVHASSSITFEETALELNSSSTTNDLTVVRVRNAESTLVSARFVGGSVAVVAPDQPKQQTSTAAPAPSVTVFGIQYGNGGIRNPVSAVFAGAFSKEPSHIGVPVVVSVAGHVSGVNLVNLPQPTSARVWADVDVKGDADMKIVNKPPVPQQCIVMTGSDLDCTVTVVSETAVAVPSLASIFRAPTLSTGFVLGAWALPIYKVTFNTTFVPIMSTFVVDVAHFANVSQSSVRVWHRIGDSNATFVVSGPESRTAFKKITGNPSKFAADMNTFVPEISGGGIYGPPSTPTEKPSPPSGDSGSKWAVVGICGGAVVVVAAASAIVWYFLKKRRVARSSGEYLAVNAETTRLQPAV